jgi:hypothetical protein
MGRKPNQLILEFFERGPKLEDASNRYQHTCRSCGEKVNFTPPLTALSSSFLSSLTQPPQFPKGRIDSLTNHLVKKCPAIPVRDRQRAILQFHDLPDLSDSPAADAGTGGQNGASRRQTMDLPFAPKHAMSALDTLAEVSRHHLDMSGKRVPSSDARGPRRRSSGQSVAGQDGFSADDSLAYDDRSGGTEEHRGHEGGGKLIDEPTVCQS